MKKTNRPVYLSLTAFAFPVTAIASILHRITGVFLFFFILVALYLFDYALTSDMQFEQVRAFLSQGIGYVGLAFSVAVIIYHLISGVRHILIDLHIGVSKQMGRASAFITFFLTGSLWGVWFVCTSGLL